jgi:hypothetical protein
MLEFFQPFKDRWEKEVPSAVACLERSLEQWSLPGVKAFKKQAS